jgi:phage gp29-like protein
MEKTNGQLKPAPIPRMSGYSDLVTSAKKRLTKYSQYFDRSMRYLTDDPTATKLKVLVRRIDDGDIAALCETQIELERKDAQFAGVVQTRRNAITALDWCVDPDPDHEDDAAAQEGADYCLERLSNIASWPKAMEHLVQAVGPNLSGVEIIWDKGEVADFVMVPCTRWATHPITNTGLVIKTDDEVMGYPIELFPDKFIVFQPYCKGGFPFRATLTHASIGPFLMGALSRIDWLAFSELFGMPLRLGYFPEGSKESDVQTLTDMLERMSTDTAGAFPDGTKVEFKQAQGTGETYREQLHYVDNKFAILWLGQTLTTDVVATGSYAAARVHNKVRSDLLASDLRAEAACYREQLFRPMIRLRFPGRDMPIPIFKRETSVIRDIDTDKMRLEQLGFAAQQGLPVPRKWLYEALGIPRPAAGDELVLKPTMNPVLTDSTSSDNTSDDEPPDVQPGDGSNDDAET